MVQKQVRTMATAEKIAPGGDWYISLLMMMSFIYSQK
jgi:hypothetical protein